MEMEARALQWIQSHLKADILITNYRCRGGEVDLIFEEGQDLVFLEVRARGIISSALLAYSYETVNLTKRRRLERAAKQYLLQYRGKAQGIRFDILGFDSGKWTHLRRAW